VTATDGRVAGEQANAGWVDASLAWNGERVSRAATALPGQAASTPTGLDTTFPVGTIGTSTTSAGVSAIAAAALPQSVWERMAALGSRSADSATAQPISAEPAKAPAGANPCDFGPDITPPDGAGPVVWQGRPICAMPGEWLVRFDEVSGDSHVQVETVEATVRSAGLVVEESRHLGMDGLFKFQVSPSLSHEQVERVLRAVPGFRYVEPNAVVTIQRTPNDPRLGDLYGMHNVGQGGGIADADIDGPEAWDVSTGSTRTIVAVIDTGIDYNHADLYRNLWINQAEIPASRMANLTDIDGDTLITFRDLNDPANQGEFKITDQNSDGLITGADILAQMNMDGGGVDQGTGGWRNNRTDHGDDAHPDDLLGYKFQPPGGRPAWDPFDDHRHGTHCAGTIGGEGDNSIGVVGVNWNVLMFPIKFLNSGGSGTWEDAVLAVDYLSDLRQRFGVDVKLSSNSWGGGAPPGSALRDAIAANGEAGMLFVAAAGNSNQDADRFPLFPAAYDLPNIISVAATTNRDTKAGFSNWGLVSVDLGAPGDNILSAVPGGGYDFMSGTSMATPHVAGAAALAWSIFRTGTYEQVRDAIFSSVDPNEALRRDGPTPVATGGRLNVHKLLLSLGFQVLASNPAANEILTTRPTEFTVDLSHPYDPSSVQPADLLVNSVPADGVTQPSPSRLTFTYTTSPVTEQGLQTMGIAHGNILAEPTSGLPELEVRPWDATFRYAAERLRVQATSPAIDSVAAVPVATMQVQFNLAVDPATVQPNDLRLSQGSASSVQMVGPATAEFTLSDVTREGTLTATITAGAVTDQFGNPMLAFTGNYILDIDAMEFPMPLTARPVLGSMVYDRSADAILNPTDDVDVFWFVASPGQTITHVITPAAGLQPVIDLYTFVNDELLLLGSSVAEAAGRPAVLGPIATPSDAPLAYFAVVYGIGGTGNYTARTISNAAAEGELHGGAANDTIATAQNLNAAFQTLAGGQASRAATLGRSDFSTGMLPEELEPNNTQATANFAAANFLPEITSLYQLGIKGAVTPATETDWFDIGTLQVDDVITVTLSGPVSSRGTLVDPYIEIYRHNGGTPVRVAGDDDAGPGLDSLIYRLRVTQEDQYYVVARSCCPPGGGSSGNYDLAVWLENAGAAPTTGGTLTRETEPNNNFTQANDASTSWRRAQWVSRTEGAITPANDTDYFEYRLTAGDLLSIDVRSLSTSLDARVNLRNAAGTVIASNNGSAMAPVRDASVYSFIIPATGAYYLQVLGQQGGTGTYTADIYLSTETPPPEPTTVYDYYSFTLAQFETVTVGVKGQTDSFVRLELVDGNDELLAVGEPGAANLDSRINNFIAPTAGTYYVRVTGRPFRDYNLLLTRGADFDTEDNGVEPQPIESSFGSDGLQRVLGHAGAGTTVDRDRYSIMVADGQTIYLQTYTPADQGGAYGNTFNPFLRLRDPSGSQVAFDDDSADGRNAVVVYAVPPGQGGVFVIEVSHSEIGSVPTQGEYVLVVAAFGTGPGSAPGGSGDPGLLAAFRMGPAVAVLPSPAAATSESAAEETTLRAVVEYWGAREPAERFAALPALEETEDLENILDLRLARVEL
jgi:subtilisin family serine protease